MAAGGAGNAAGAHLSGIAASSEAQIAEEQATNSSSTSYYEQLGTVLMLLFGLGLCLAALAMVMFLWIEFFLIPSDKQIQAEIWPYVQPNLRLRT